MNAIYITAAVIAYLFGGWLMLITDTALSIIDTTLTDQRPTFIGRFPVFALWPLILIGFTIHRVCTFAWRIINRTAHKLGAMVKSILERWGKE